MTTIPARGFHSQKSCAKSPTLPTSRTRRCRNSILCAAHLLSTSLLALWSIASLPGSAHAQNRQQASAQEVEVVVTVPAGGCAAVPVSSVPGGEQAVYNVSTTLKPLVDTNDTAASVAMSIADGLTALSAPATSPLDIRSSCSPLVVTQSLPQSVEHFALSAFTPDPRAATPNCTAMLQGDRRWRSYGTDKALPVTPILFTPLEGLSYTVCSDVPVALHSVTWEEFEDENLLDYGTFDTPALRDGVVGPFRTWIAFSNPCAEFSVNVTVSIRRNNESSPEAYCSELAGITRNEKRVRALAIVAFVTSIFSLVICCCTITRYCTCWCCCAFPGHPCFGRCPLPCNLSCNCDCACSRAIYRTWARLPTMCGLSWVVGGGGGVRIYIKSARRGLLFWTIFTSALATYQHLNIASYERPGTLNPDLQDSAAIWGYGRTNDILIVRFITAMSFGLSATVPAFAATIFSYSNPLRDPSFRSKRAVTVVSFLVSNVTLCVIMADLFMHVHVWSRPAYDAIITVSLLISVVMSFVSLAKVVYKTSPTRLKRLERLTPPHHTPILLQSPNASAKHAAASRSTGPPQPLPCAVVVEPPLTIVPSVRLNNAASDAPPTAPGRPRPIGEAVLESSSRGTPPLVLTAMSETSTSDSHSQLIGRGARDRRDLLGQRAHASEPAIPECRSKEAEAGAPADSAWQKLRRCWHNVREDSSFRYSAYFLASVLMAVVTLSASFPAALQSVHSVAECTDTDSQCFDDIQAWLFKRVTRGYDGVVNPQAVRQYQEVCESSAVRAKLAGMGASASLPAVQVEAVCSILSFLIDSAASGSPKWLPRSRTPIIIGGKIGFTIAYVLGLYTIYHIARAYKRFATHAKADKLVGVLFNKMSASIDVELEIGRDKLRDMKRARIGQSAYFTGMLVSTCFLQLWWAGSLLTIIIACLLHPSFWEVVGHHYEWVVSIIILFAWHVLSQRFLNTYIAPNATIKHPFTWLFLYITFSSVYVVAAIYVTAQRVAKLLLSTVFSLSLLDENIFTVGKAQDNGYSSFLAMALMLHALEERERQDQRLPTLSTLKHGLRSPADLSTRSDAASTIHAAGEPAGTAATDKQARALERWEVLRLHLSTIAAKGRALDLRV